MKKTARPDSGRAGGPGRPGPESTESPNASAAAPPAGWRAPMSIVAHNDGPELRGCERQLLLLARGLAARGHEVAVSCRADAPLARDLRAASDVEVTPVRPRGDLALGSALAFRRLIRERRP